MVGFLFWFNKLSRLLDLLSLPLVLGGQQLNLQSLLTLLRLLVTLGNQLVDLGLGG